MRSLYVLGYGRMARALHAGFAKDAFEAVIAVPREQAWIAAHAGQARHVLLAVKPQSLPQALPTLARLCAEGATVVSVLAGVSAEQIAVGIGASSRKINVIRTMPNLGAAAGAGTAAVFADSSDLTQADRDLLHAIFGVEGTVYVPDPVHAPAVTALSGSGPAYFFYLVEALAAAGIAAGLPPQTAQVLARRTLLDAAALLGKDADRTPQALRADVTSPGGTTAAALAVLMPAFDAALNAAVAAAVARCRALSYC